MTRIRIHDKIFTPYISKEDIQQKVGELADALNRDYHG